MSCLERKKSCLLLHHCPREPRQHSTHTHQHLEWEHMEMLCIPQLCESPQRSHEHLQITIKSIYSWYTQLGTQISIWRTYLFVSCPLLWRAILWNDPSDLQPGGCLRGRQEFHPRLYYWVQVWAGRSWPLQHVWYVLQCYYDHPLQDWGRYPWFSSAECMVGRSFGCSQGRIHSPSLLFLHVEEFEYGIDN